MIVEGFRPSKKVNFDPQLKVVDGLPGSGKTANCVEHDIIPVLIRGGVVITNIIIYMDKVRKLAGSWGVRGFYHPVKSSDFAQLRDIVKEYQDAGEKNILVVLDEGHLEFCSRDHSTFPKQVRSFVAQHRKLRCTLIIISQNYGQIDNTFLRTARSFTLCKQFGHWPLVGWFFKFFFPPFFLIKTVGNAGGVPDPKLVYSRSFSWISSKHANCYDTTQLLDSTENVEPQKFIKPPYWKRQAVLVVMVYLAWSDREAAQAAKFAAMPKKAAPVAPAKPRFGECDVKFKLVGLDDTTTPIRYMGEFARGAIREFITSAPLTLDWDPKPVTLKNYEITFLKE